MAGLYVYYRVLPENLQRAQVMARELQRLAVDEFGGMQARLLHRTGTLESAQTWLEVYEPAPSALEDFLEARARTTGLSEVIGTRVLERFADFT